MSYRRVVPLDLFNEANLLKCLGQLYLRTEHIAHVELTEPEDHDPFMIGQDHNSGAIHCLNVVLVINGDRCALERPLNSRHPYPLYLTHIGYGELDDPVGVLDDNGELTAEFAALIEARRP